MMRSGLVALCVSLTAAVASASQVPARVRASAYLCRADRIRICKGEQGLCQVEPGRAVFQVNFVKNTFRAFGSDPKFDEHIVYKGFKDRSDSSSFVRDTHYVVLDGGARFIVFGRPDSAPMQGDTVPATFVDADDQGVITHFLRCQPQ